MNSKGQLHPRKGKVQDGKIEKDELVQQSLVKPRVVGEINSPGIGSKLETLSQIHDLNNVESPITENGGTLSIFYIPVNY